jgi:hypothetical protein
VVWLAGVLDVVELAVVLDTRAARRGGHPTIGNVGVRCRRAHLFTTIWVAGVSVKAVRLSGGLIQRCPVCEHWTRVTRVTDADLTVHNRRVAASHRDARIRLPHRYRIGRHPAGAGPTF